jgi:hypothetical protein
MTEENHNVRVLHAPDLHGKRSGITTGTAMSPSSPALADFRRIAVKVGSSLLVDAEAGRVRGQWLAALAEDIAHLHRDGRDVLVVSSGSIALGRAVLRLPKGPSSSRTARQPLPSDRSLWHAPGPRRWSAMASPPGRSW